MLFSYYKKLIRYLSARYELQSLIVCCFFYGLFFLFFKPIFEVTDDSIMKSIINGTYTGSPSPYVVFINYALANTLVIFYKKFPSIDWYMLLWYTISFVSLFSFVMIILNNIKGRFGQLMTLLFIGIFFIRFMLQVQFTTIATLSVTAGVYLYLFLQQKKIVNSFFYHSLSFTLIILGSMIRTSSFLLILILSLPLFVSLFVRKSTQLKTLFFVLCVFITFLSLQKIHTYNYQKDPAWGKYMELQKWRGQYHEYELFNYAMNTSIYDQIGWSSNDYLMIRNNFYFNEKIFSTNVVKSIIVSVKQKGITFHVLTHMIAFFILLIGKALPLLSIASLHVILYYDAFTKNHKKTLGSIFMISMAVLLYFSYLGRLPERVILPIIFFSGLLPIYFNISVSHSHELKIIKKNYSFLIFFVCTTGMLIYYLMLSSYQNNQIKILKEETQHLPLGTNTLTFVWSPSLPLHYSSVFDTSPLIKSENILWGGWTQRTPHDNTKLKRQGINNFDTALYNKKNIYLVAQPYLLKILQSYIKEHYNTDVTFKVLYSYKRSPFETNLVQVIKK